MEKNTKRILAIVLVVAIAGAGIGVGIWFFTSQAQEAGWETPGVSGIPSDRWIKCGYVGGLKGIQGAGGWNGAWLAAYDINTKDDGIDVNGTRYYVAVKARDTNEHDPSLPISQGLAAAENLIYVDEARYLFGGFRTEVTRAMVELAMDEDLIFFGAGSATDEFCINVKNDYPRYKYYFRQTPISSSKLAFEIVKGFCHLINVMEANLSKRVNKVAILREQLDWTTGMSDLFNGFAALVNYTVVYEVAYDITSPDFETYWDLVESSGAQIAIPVVSGDTGIQMMKQYAITQPQAVVFGIDVEGQMTTYPSTTGGACEYEILMTTLPPDCPVTPYTAQFYDDYLARFNIGPTIYTAGGTYDAVGTLVWAINQTQSFDELDIIAKLETLNKTVYLSAPRGVSAPRLSYTTGLEPGGTTRHDVVEGWPYGTGRFAQWQDGVLKCIPTGEDTYYTWGIDVPGYPTFSNWSLGIYPDVLAGSNTIRLPPWGIN
ncbi:MAG: ABC transporter substrate-binding protein [Candidatus Lokiarchaeota archaeon]|nr:ABC transporter substrate-binding protein [Candidatus Lokiarchaeota archaeon]